jgi:two-component system, OmpR family, phosphate regulon response regulator PhoB
VLTILVADDEFANLEIISAALQAEGHRVLRAGDGIDALRILATHTVDVVVCDELMRGLGGPQLVDAMLAEPRYRSIPVIMMVEPFGRRAPLMTRATIVHKPVLIPQLLAMVDQVHREAS